MHAGILEGSVADIMVMDIWQASLLRALAKQQLRDAASSLDEAVETVPEERAAEVEDQGADCDDITTNSAVQAKAVPADGADGEWGPADLEDVNAVRTQQQQQQRTHV